MPEEFNPIYDIRIRGTKVGRMTPLEEDAIGKSAPDRFMVDDEPVVEGKPVLLTLKVSKNFVLPWWRRGFLLVGMHNGLNGKWRRHRRLYLKSRKLKRGRV